MAEFLRPERWAPLTENQREIVLWESDRAALAEFLSPERWATLTEEQREIVLERRIPEENNKLRDFAIRVIEDPDLQASELQVSEHKKIQGPRTEDELTMVLVFLGEQAGNTYPRYTYWENEPYKTRYQELGEWALNAFEKWRQEKPEE